MLLQRTNPSNHYHTRTTGERASCCGQRVPWTRLQAAQAATAYRIAIEDSGLKSLSRREGLLVGLCLVAAAAGTTPSAVAAVSQPDIEQLEVSSWASIACRVVKNWL